MPISVLLLSLSEQFDCCTHMKLFLNACRVFVFKKFFEGKNSSFAWSGKEENNNTTSRMQTLEIYIPISLLCSQTRQSLLLRIKNFSVMAHIMYFFPMIHLIHIWGQMTFLFVRSPSYTTKASSSSIVECAGWREIQNSIYWMGKVRIYMFDGICLLSHSLSHSSWIFPAFPLFQHVIKVSHNFCPFSQIGFS